MVENINILLHGIITCRINPKKEEKEKLIKEK